MIFKSKSVNDNCTIRSHWWSPFIYCANYTKSPNCKSLSTIKPFTKTNCVYSFTSFEFILTVSFQYVIKKIELYFQILQKFYVEITEDCSDVRPIYKTFAIPDRPIKFIFNCRWSFILNKIADLYEKIIFTSSRGWHHKRNCHLMEYCCLKTPRVDIEIFVRDYVSSDMCHYLMNHFDIHVYLMT